MTPTEARAIQMAMIDSSKLAYSLTPWQPIESAPKDGTEILTINVHWWTPVNGNNRWLYGKIKQSSWNGHKFDNDGLQPTHWMPMPPMPCLDKNGDQS